MAWRETIKQQSDGRPMVGRFRGARFVMSGRMGGESGRRTQLHEFPLRDQPYVEDLGPATKRIELEVFVDGSLAADGDYTRARDALIDALEQPGSGTLVHPFLGTLRVTLAGKFSWSEESREGGRARFTMAFIRGGEQPMPAAVHDTQDRVKGAASDLQSAADAAFAKRWDVALPQAQVIELQAELARTLEDAHHAVTSAAERLRELINTPADMTALVLGGLNEMAAMAQSPLVALGLYRDLFHPDTGAPSVPLTTQNRRTQASSTAAWHAWLAQTALVGAASAAAEVDYTSRDQALNMATTLAEQCDAVVEVVDPASGAPVDDDVYRAIGTLRTTLVADLRLRGARLPKLVSYTPPSGLPVLVIAHQRYGDARREAEVVVRNNIANPVFVPAGMPLELLSE